MTRPARPEAPPAVPALPLPSSGGAWLRLADGTLIRDPEAAETPVEPAVKDT